VTSRFNYESSCVFSRLVFCVCTLRISCSVLAQIKSRFRFVQPRVLRVIVWLCWVRRIAAFSFGAIGCWQHLDLVLCASRQLELVVCEFFFVANGCLWVGLSPGAVSWKSNVFLSSRVCFVCSCLILCKPEIESKFFVLISKMVCR
jgi:hypothetical protein